MLTQGRPVAAAIFAVLMLAGAVLFLQARPAVFGVVRRAERARTPAPKRPTGPMLQGLNDAHGRRRLAQRGPDDRRRGPPARRSGASAAPADQPAAGAPQLRRLRERPPHRGGQARGWPIPPRRAPPSPPSPSTSAIGSLGPFNRAFRAATGCHARPSGGARPCSRLAGIGRSRLISKSARVFQPRRDRRSRQPASWPTTPGRLPCTHVAARSCALWLGNVTVDADGATRSSPSRSGSSSGSCCGRCCRPRKIREDSPPGRASWRRSSCSRCARSRSSRPSAWHRSAWTGPVSIRWRRWPTAGGRPGSATSRRRDDRGPRRLLLLDPPRDAPSAPVPDVPPPPPRSHNPSPFTAYSFDVGEAFLMVGFVVAVAADLPDALGGDAACSCCTRSSATPCCTRGYELMPARADGRPWFDFLTTTTHHDLHHAQAG